MKKALIAIPLALLLGACQQQTYQIGTGKVVSKEIDAGRYSDFYDVDVAYPIGNGKYTIGTVDVGDQSNFNKYNVNDKVTVYFNDKGIGQITK